MKKKTVAGDIYSHWLAVALYDLYMNGMSNIPFVQPSDASVTQIVNSVRTTVALQENNSELMFTSLLARAVDRFLFPDAKLNMGACLHQAPVFYKTHHPERPDFAIVTFPQHKLLGVADFKKDTFAGAHQESFAYAVRLVEGSEDKFSLRLVFPFTRHQLSLQLHVPFTNYMMVLEIANVSIPTPDLQKFFTTFYAAVHYLITPHTAMDLDTPHIAPTPSLVFVGEHCLTPDNIHMPARVFKKDNCIHKLYDTMKFSVNLNILRLSLADATAQNLTQDGRFQLLTYPFRDGQHTPFHKDQFVPLIKTLRAIHSAGYVHSDIRRANLVFSPDKKRAWILDFDLAGCKGTCYPPNFNHRLPERHGTARQGQPRKTVHDWYSFGFIMEVDQQRVGIGTDVIAAVKKGEWQEQSLQEQ